MSLRPNKVIVSNHSLKSVSLVNVKRQLRILDDDEDDILSQYIETATNSLESWTGYTMMPATYLAKYDYCKDCTYGGYFLGGRPFYQLDKVEIKVDSLLTDVNVLNYKIQENDWDTLVCIKSTVEIDQSCDIEDNCPIVLDPVQITYEVGERVILDVSTITISSNVATVVTSNVHNLTDGDQVIMSDTGENDLNGTFTVIIISSTSFSYVFIGSASNSVIGNAIIPIIPRPLQLAVMQMVASMYENRGDCSDKCGSIPCGAQLLASPYKKLIMRSSRRKARGRDDCNCW